MLRQLRSRLRLIVAALCAAALPAERLPIQVYTPADGLSQSTIHSIHRDARGFFWFGASEGLSRYDGYEFVTFRERGRQRQHRVRAVIDGSDGALWAGTDEGICRLETIPGKPIFDCRKPDGLSEISVYVLLEERPGEILAGTSKGLYRMKAGRVPEFSPIQLSSSQSARLGVWAIRRGGAGDLWVGATNGIHRLPASKPAAHLSRGDGLPSEEVRSLEFDPDGNLWAATSGGLCQIRTSGDRPTIERIFTTKDGLPADTVKVVHFGVQDTLWAGTTAGIAEAVRHRTGRVTGFRPYSQQHGLSHVDVDTMEDDQAGNLWIGSQSNGAMKLTRGGFVSYGVSDGLGSPYVMSMMETRSGQICAMTRVPGKLHLNFLESERFRSVAVPVEASYYSSRWSGWSQVAAESSDGRWWIGSERGLLLFPPEWMRSRQSPSAIFNQRTGLLTDHIYQIFRDSQGGIWVATRYDGTGIARRDPKTGVFHQFTAAEGLPPVEDARPNGFGEDSHGQIWIGWWRTGVLRFSKGRFEYFGAQDGVPAGGIRRVLTDRHGRVWIGSGGGGVARIDNPTANRPAFRIYGTAEGLSAAEIQSLAEDSFGRIYIGHGLGVDRIDPDAEGPLRVRRFTKSDGLAGGEQQTAIRGRKGVLWFGSVEGVSRLIPAPDRPRSAPAVYITNVRVNGQAVRPDLRLGSLRGSRDQLQIDYVSPRFTPGEIIEYQYRLSETATWSTPSTQRSVQFPDARENWFAYP